MARRRLIVTGGGGRLGRLLRHCWRGKDLGTLVPVFLARQDWDILCTVPPRITDADIVLDLAGLVKGEVEQNPVIAGRVAGLAADAGARLVHMSSAAVYRGGTSAMLEEDEPSPHSTYGHAKLQAERAVFLAMPGAHVLRLANVAGADSLLANLRMKGPVALDPVPGQPAGPLRSYIGPMTFAEVILSLLGRVVREETLPAVLNIAQPGPVSMAELLDASGHPWSFGPEREGVLARMELSTDLLQGLCDVPPATAAGLLAELDLLGDWP